MFLNAAVAVSLFISLSSVHSSLIAEDKKPDDFLVSVSSLTESPDQLFYRGRVLDANHESISYIDGQETLASNSRFPNAFSCLSKNEGAEFVSLAKLDTDLFNSVYDLEVCFQHVGNELQGTSKVSHWLRELGFTKAGERPFSRWRASNFSGLTANDVIVYQAYWSGGDKHFGKRYPFSREYRWKHTLFAKNLVVTIVVRRADNRVIGVYAVNNFL